MTEDELGGEEVAESMNETTLCETGEKQKRLNVYTVEWVETEEERGEIKGNAGCQGKKKVLTG